jgi:signal transduction histidine kinase
MIKDSERLSRLISQVLDLEKYDSGRQKLHLSRCDWNDIFDECTALLSQKIKEKQLSIAWKGPKPSKLFIADRDKIIQVVLNLLANAIHHVDDLGIIRFSIKEDKTYFLVSVEDDGKGIAPEYTELIFEKFYQTKDQNLRKPKGSGLGLAICKRIVELHQGDIGVHSELGKGSRFFFRIPILTEESDIS